eukprot:augustus_masked-scaffold_7-processed-gene-15.53-mRNA-1 protein AED:1.00 eAED:1.00 QI:0/0/0/0/1/1/2/0/640
MVSLVPGYDSDSSQEDDKNTEKKEAEELSLSRRLNQLPQPKNRKKSKKRSRELLLASRADLEAKIAANFNTEKCSKYIGKRKIENSGDNNSRFLVTKAGKDELTGTSGPSKPLSNSEEYRKDKEKVLAICPEINATEKEIKFGVKDIQENQNDLERELKKQIREKGSIHNFEESLKNTLVEVTSVRHNTILSHKNDSKFDQSLLPTQFGLNEGKSSSTTVFNRRAGRGKHQIGTLLNDAEEFETEFEEQKKKSRQGLASAARKYGCKSSPVQAVKNMNEKFHHYLKVASEIKQKEILAERKEYESQLRYVKMSIFQNKTHGEINDENWNQIKEMVMNLKRNGNELFLAHSYQEAIKKYEGALAYFDFYTPRCEMNVRKDGIRDEDLKLSKFHVSSSTCSTATRDESSILRIKLLGNLGLAYTKNLKVTESTLNAEQIRRIRKVELLEIVSVYETCLDAIQFMNSNDSLLVCLENKTMYRLIDALQEAGRRTEVKEWCRKYLKKYPRNVKIARIVGLLRAGEKRTLLKEKKLFRSKATLDTIRCSPTKGSKRVRDNIRKLKYEYGLMQAFKKKLVREGREADAQEIEKYLASLDTGSKVKLRRNPKEKIFYILLLVFLFTLGTRLFSLITHVSSSQRKFHS